ncbi:MAG: hypothetical protein LW806_10265 [Planctomycetaceae bacterium]|nr:hypothetical protein [Planctomycetaceae bacterium]
MRRTTVLLSLALTTSVLAAGCLAPGTRAAPRREKPVTGSTDFSRSAASEKISSEELDEITNAFADRYRTLMEDAVAAIVKNNPDARARATAQRFLVESTTSAYDIVTNGDPFSQVLDLTIMVTLTSQVWIDDDRATREFGPERAEPLVSSLRQAREEIWRIASRVFLPDQLAALDFMIASWRRDNRGVEDTSFVRFDDFAEQRGEGLIRDVASGGGLFQPLNQAIDESVAYRKLGERIFYLAKRMPTLANWQTQAFADEMLAKEETKRALANLDGVSKSVESLGATVTQLAADVPKIVAEERTAIFAEIDRRQKDIDSALGQVNAIAGEAAKAAADARAIAEGVSPILGDAQKTLEAAQPTLDAVQKLVETSERLLGKVAEIKGPPVPPDPNAPPAKPFDIADYQKMLGDATVALGEANRLLENADSLAGSKSVKGLIDEVTQATEQRIESLENMVTRVVYLVGAIAAGIVVLGFALLFAYRATGARGGTRSMKGGAA